MMISKVDFLELVGTSTKNPALIEIDTFHHIPPANLKYMLAKFGEYAMKERRKIHYLKADKTNPHPWHCCLCQDIKTLILKKNFSAFCFWMLSISPNLMKYCSSNRGMLTLQSEFASTEFTL